MEKNYPSSTKVVVIGGGVAGTSCAYHLAKFGWKNIVLLERDQLTSGTTWHAAGLLGQLGASSTITKLRKYSLDLYKELGPNWYPSWENGDMKLDVGDHYTQALRDANYEYFVCPNTHNNPDLLRDLSEEMIDKHDIFADKALSDTGQHT